MFVLCSTLVVAALAAQQRPCPSDTRASNATSALPVIHAPPVHLVPAVLIYRSPKDIPQTNPLYVVSVLEDPIERPLVAIKQDDDLELMIRSLARSRTRDHPTRT